MKPIRWRTEWRNCGSMRLLSVAMRYAVAFSAGVLAMCALPVAGSITVQNLPAEGLAAVDAQRNVFMVTGGGCAGFMPPTCNPMRLLKVDGAGATVFNVPVGPATGGPQTLPRGMSVDTAGNVYVAGTITTYSGTTDSVTAFAGRWSADGAQRYFTYLPGLLATPAAIRADSQGNAYIAGTASDYRPFAAKLSPDGSTFLYTVHLAGSLASATNPDVASGLAVDSGGNAVMVGTTRSPDFPVTAGAVQAKLPAASSVFVTRLDPSGKVVASTFLGGATASTADAVALDPTGNIYVAGTTAAGFPTTPGAYESVPVVPLWSNGAVGFVAKLTASASAIAWSTYRESNGRGLLAVDNSGEVYVVESLGAGVPTTASAPQPCFGGYYDVSILHLSAQGTLADATYLGAHESSPLGFALASDGSVLIAAHSADLKTEQAQPILAQVRFGGAGWTAPACLSSNIVSAATFQGLYLGPGDFVSLTGYGIGPDTGVSYQPGPHGEAPTSLGGVTVAFNGIPGPIIYAQSRQVNALVPFEASGTKVQVALTYRNATFGPFTMDSSTGSNPGIFRLQPGVSTQAAALNQDGSVNGPSNPAPRGSVVSVFGTGFEPLAPPCSTGALNPSGSVSWYIQYALTTPGADGLGERLAVQYSGLAPTLLCGVEQINFVVPADAASGAFLVTPGDNPGHGSTIVVQ